MRERAMYPRLFSIFLLLFGLGWSGVTAQSGGATHRSEPTVSFSGSVIATAAFVDDLDDPVPHFSDKTGHHAHGSLRESTVSMAFQKGEWSGRTTVDFMGPGLELVTLSAIWTRGPLSVLLGKDENLVSTRERTLFYDAYFTSGGIQTGAKANINQVRVSWKIHRSLTIQGLLTDEKPVNGGTDGVDFTLDGPGVELSAHGRLGRFQWRVAGHRGAVKLENGAQFRPSLVMADGTWHLGERTSLYGAAFRGQAGSKFFPADTLPDYVFTLGRGVREVSGHGAQLQLVRDGERWNAWVGAGAFSLSDRSVAMLQRTTIPDLHALARNTRFSSGVSFRWNEHTEIGAEFATFSTRHVDGSAGVNVGSGSVFLVKITHSL